MRAASCFLGGFFFREEEGPFLFPTYLSKALSSQGTFEHKTNNSALAVNALHSHGPGNEEASRKWGSPLEAPRKGSRKPPDRIILDAIFDAKANCKEVQRCL